MNDTLRISAVHEQQALAWLGLLHDQPSGGDRARFNRWLQADPAHARAYAQAQLLWALAEVPAAHLAQEDAAALNGLLQAMDRPRRSLARRSGGLAMAVCLVLMIGIGAGWHPLDWLEDFGADYVSQGQVRTVTLADQSEVTLDADSAIAVDFDQGQRHVELRRGAAFFHVRHTGAPFTVRANGGEARVLGTQFEVRRQAGGARVTVLSGRVGVTAGPGQPQAVLTAGQQLAYANGHADALRVVDGEAQLAWRQGWLTYYQAPLADVVSDLARHYPGRILLLNDELAARKVSGSFPGADPQAVLNSLQQVLGFQQSRLFGRLIVLR
jgi:transmembrane sensor